jgi:hypothetical protein
MKRFCKLCLQFEVAVVRDGDVQGGDVARGRAVQVDPIKPMLKPPGTQLLKLNCDVLLSTSALKFYLRRYSVGGLLALSRAFGDAFLKESGRFEAGAYTPPLFSST